MNLHKDVGRNGYHKEKRVLVRELGASYPDDRKQVEDGLFRRQRSFLTGLRCLRSVPKWDKGTKVPYGEW